MVRAIVQAVLHQEAGRTLSAQKLSINPRPGKCHLLSFEAGPSTINFRLGALPQLMLEESVCHCFGNFDEQ